jgi:hypothetical protein
MLECCSPRVVGIEIHMVCHGWNTFILEQIKFGNNSTGIYCTTIFHQVYSRKTLNVIVEWSALLVCTGEATGLNGCEISCHD